MIRLGLGVCAEGIGNGGPARRAIGARNRQAPLSCRAGQWDRTDAGLERARPVAQESDGARHRGAARHLRCGTGQVDLLLLEQPVGIHAPGGNRSRASGSSIGTGRPDGRAAGDGHRDPGLAYAPGSRRSLPCGAVEEEAGRLTARTNVGALLDDRAEYVLARAFDAGSIAYLPLSSSSDVTCRCRRFRRSRCTRRSGVTIATACRCGRLLCRYWPAQGRDRNTPETCREGQCPTPWPGRVIR